MDTLLPWAGSVLLASVRLTLGLAMTPLFSAFGVPMVSRLILVLVFASLAVSGAPQPAAGLVSLDGGFLSSLMSEMAIGLLMAVGVHTAFAAFAVAGRLIDAQMGFTLGAVLDPVSQGHAAVMASGLNLLAVVLFFVTDVHHLLLAGFFRTFELLPLGQALSVGGWLPMAQGAGMMFVLGFAMASPVVVALLLTDVVVGVVSRNMPQMNVLFLSIPLKVLLGIAVMVVSVRLLGPVAHKVLMLPLTLLDKVQ